LNPIEIKRGIEKGESLSGRLNIVKTKNYTIIDDCYNASPASVKASISTLALSKKRKVAILGTCWNWVMIRNVSRRNW
jgi:UDP-N-acetylmuramoyl-tripeptide--D-alanyl-D-alanine ligase